MSVTVTAIGIAALLDYAAIDWISVSCDLRGNTTWVFDCDEATLESYREAWTSKEGMPITNARVFFESLKRLELAKKKAWNSAGRTADNNIYLGFEKKAT